MGSSIVNRTRDYIVASQLEEARGFWERARGLIGHPPLQEGEGLLIASCRWIHTLGMAFPIDLLYLDREGKVVGVCPSLRPNKIGPLVWGADSVLELPTGTIARSRTKLGDRLERITPEEQVN